ncbi:MAG TPA: metallophosphoesterase [Candidatus Eisenbacteria bacterium]|nr:metallophosphoesterase [Candidatus Eisenbacteria bacterium]
MTSDGVRIAHLSDFHYDGSREVRLALNRMIGLAARGLPDVVVITGDLSASGRPSELDDVARALEALDPLPRLVIAGNRDLEPATGPPGDAQPLPADSDLDFFLALEPALALGFEDESGDAGRDPATTFAERFGPLEPSLVINGTSIVGVTTTPKLSAESLEKAAKRLRASNAGIRVLALHHGVLPVPGRKLRAGDLVARAGDVIALGADIGIDLILHGHIHRANAWQVTAGARPLVVASAGALVNDGRRDASYLEIVIEAGAIEVRRRSVASGREAVLFSGSTGPSAGEAAGPSSGASR